MTGQRASNSICPSCGAEAASDAPRGYCLKCLFALGAGETDAEAQSSQLSTLNSQSVPLLNTRQETRSWPSAPGDWMGEFSRDGTWYLTSVAIPNATFTSLWNLTNGRETRLDREWHSAAALAFNGELAALGGWNRTVQLWETSTCSNIATFSGYLGTVESVAFSPDNKRLVTGSGGKETVKVWDVQSHEELLTLDSPETMFRAAAFSPDGNIIAANNERVSFHLWRAPSWAEIEAQEKRLRRDSRR